MLVAAGASPLSPVIKSLVAVNEPPAVLHRGRTPLMRRIESRFRFLAVRHPRSRLPLGHWLAYRSLSAPSSPTVCVTSGTLM